MAQIHIEPSLPKLLALDKAHHDFDQRVREAATIAKIRFGTVSGGNNDSTSVPSRTRSEFALRWALEKLKTPESRELCFTSELIWPFLDQLVMVVPTASVARLLQSSRFVKNVGALLHEAATNASNQLSDAEPKVQPDEAKSSKKRKRGEKKPSLSPEPSSALSYEQFERSVLGVATVLQNIIALADGASDAASRAHISSALKLGAKDSADLLHAWLRCLSRIFSTSAWTQSLLPIHEAFLRIWSSRSRDQNDETGASAKTFSTNCLSAVVSIFSAPTTELSGGSDGLGIQASLEQLIAKHVFIPAKTLFDISQSSRSPDVKKARVPLNDYLLNLKSNISASGPAAVSALPRLLDLAIRLSPSSTPTQASAQIPWLESVFAGLAACGGEDLQEKDEKPASNGVIVAARTSHLPLTAMLKVLKARDINMSSVFLEDILVCCSGLKDLQERQPQALRLDVVAAILDLNGGVFLKIPTPPGGTGADSVPVAQAGQPPYVEALIGSLSEVKWSSASLSTSVTNSAVASSRTASFAVNNLLVPLLRAYSSSRKLPQFISLWFWEARRNWKCIGAPNEETQSPWLSSSLVQALRDVLETSLSTSRVAELLVEFILPIRQLLDEATRSSTEHPDWAEIPSAAPASAAIVILDALLHGNEREETFQSNQAAWLALKDLPAKLAVMDLTRFPAHNRVWSIITRVYTLSYLVDGKASFLKQQKALLQGDNLFIKAVMLADWNPELDDSKQPSDLMSTALKFIWAVCGLELDTELRDAAQSTLEAILQGFLITAKKVLPSGECLAFDTYLAQIMSLCIHHPTTFSLLPRATTRLPLLKVIPIRSSEPRISEFMSALVDTLLDGDSFCLEDTVSVLVDHVTDGPADELPQHAVLECLLQVSPDLVPRVKREAVLDNIAWLKRGNEEKSEGGSVEQSVALVVRMLAGGPCGSAKIYTDVSGLIRLAEVLDEHVKRAQNSNNDLRALRLVKAANGLVLSIMEQILVVQSAQADIFEERSTKFCSQFMKLAPTKLDSLIMPKSLTLPDPVTVLLMKCFLVAASSLPKVPADLPIMKKKLQKLLQSTVTHEDQCPARSWVRLKVISEILAMPSSGAEEIELGEQALAQQQSRDQINAVSATEIDSALRPTIVVPEFAARLSSTTTAQDSCRILDIFDRRMSDVRIQTKMSAITQLLDSGKAQELRMLHVLLKRLGLDETFEHEAAKQILLRLCSLLGQSRDVGQFGGALSCISSILLTKTFLVTQYGLDTLLSTLTTMVSAQSPALAPKHGEFIFTRICQVINSIILLHRRKVGGRMHLLVALLQSLMSCFFTPHRYQTTSSRPAWLPPTITLGVGPAMAYTRILSTLCSPTTSSTTRHQASASLIDEKKKAKEYAGQYVSYLLLHYCALQLQFSGGLGPGVLEKLKQGLWAVMEIVDVEAMRGMNAGMDKGERVVWSGLWSEWHRVGKFKLK